MTQLPPPERTEEERAAIARQLEAAKILGVLEHNYRANQRDAVHRQPNRHQRRRRAATNGGRK